MRACPVSPISAFWHVPCAGDAGGERGFCEDTGVGTVRALRPPAPETGGAEPTQQPLTASRPLVGAVPSSLHSPHLCSPKSSGLRPRGTRLSPRRWWQNESNRHSRTFCRVCPQLQNSAQGRARVLQSPHRGYASLT